MRKTAALLLIAAMVGIQTACAPPAPAASGTAAGHTTAAGATDGMTAGSETGPAGESGQPTGHPSGGKGSQAGRTTARRTAKTNPPNVPTTPTTKRGGIDWGSAGSARLLLKTPAHGAMATPAKPLFQWSRLTKAKSYTFYLEEKSGSTYRQIKRVTGITKTEYPYDGALKPNVEYRWRVDAVTDSGTQAHYGSSKGGAVFMVSFDPKTHPANKNKQYAFDGGISQEVLQNYLRRSITLSMISNPSNDPESDTRFVLNTGAKYISRAIIPWRAETEYVHTIAGYKARIDAMHQLDPDLVFETCIFETVDKSCEQLAIPDWVFKAFDQPVVKRNYQYRAMLFDSGKYVNEWGADFSVPDITKLETQMYFYHRACKYIDAGFEAIHWGQVMLVGENDPSNAIYQKVINMVRRYAKTHARRHFIINNAHTHGMMGPDNVLVLDCHGFPIRAKVDPDQPAHPPAEGNPQEAYLEVGYLNSLFRRSMGGQTYSGWTCASLPYFVELDNGNGYLEDRLNQPSTQYDMWGMDEISWYANQPASYRHSWLQYAFDWIKKTDPAGALMMPGSRPAYLQSEGKMSWYYANSREFCSNGFGDEDAIRSVWSSDAK